MKKKATKKLQLTTETIARLEVAEVKRAMVGGSCHLGCESEYCNLQFFTWDCC